MPIETSDKKKVFHNSTSSSSSVFPKDDKITPVSSIPVGSTGSYGEGMEYADKEIKKNSNFKKSND